MHRYRRRTFKMFDDPTLIKYYSGLVKDSCSCRIGLVDREVLREAITEVIEELLIRMSPIEKEIEESESIKQGD